MLCHVIPARNVSNNEYKSCELSELWARWRRERTERTRRALSRVLDIRGDGSSPSGMRVQTYSSQPRTRQRPCISLAMLGSMTSDGSDDPPRLLPVDPGFAIQAEVAERVVKGEDVHFMHRCCPDAMGRATPPTSGPPSTWKLNYDVFCVCDGHSGTAAANYVRDNLLKTLHPLMPSVVPTSFRSKSGAMFARNVRQAICKTLFKLNKDFSAIGVLSGCTCTVAIVTGALLTVANLGDSDAILDCFNDVHKMSVPHRINDNLMERKRVKEAGSYMATISMSMNGAAAPGEAGVGPLRIWPGGLCVSRGVGDIDVGPVVIAKPHIRQVIIPQMGARLVLASDGVWDCIPPKLVSKVMKKLATQAAAEAVCDKCLRCKQGFLIDDTTCMVVDFVPYGVESFKGFDPQKFMGDGSFAVSNNSASASAPNWFNPSLHKGYTSRSTSLFTQPINEVTLDPNAAPALASNPSVAPTDVSLHVVEMTDASNDSSRHNRQSIATEAPVSSSPGVGSPVSISKEPHAARKGGLLCCFKPAADAEAEVHSSVRKQVSGVGPLAPADPSVKCIDTSNSSRIATSDPSHHHEVSQAPANESSQRGSGSRNILSRMLSNSVHGGRVNEVLPKVVLFADVDMEYEFEEEMSQTDVAASSGASSAKGMSPQEEFDMGFEPSVAVQQAQDTPLWHSMAPETSDFTTRPHRFAGASALVAV